MRQRSTMVPLRWTQMSLFLILMLQVTAKHQSSSFFTVRVGDEVTFPCGNVINNQHNCDSKTWIFSDKKRTLTLYEYGQIHREAASRSDRLSVTADCSLVLKKVTEEDAGRYTCRQFISGRQGSDSGGVLSVINSDESTQKPTLTKLTTTPTKGTSVARHSPTDVNNQTQRAVSLWWSLIASAVSAALLITIMAIILFKKTKGNKEKENPELSFNPEVAQSAPETSQETADPDDNVSYTYISFTNQTSQREQVSDTVTYSSVKATSCRGGDSIDPNSLYSTVNKQKK